uniref:Uncharacterized protein n=1 Tax=Acrobeloides nanus TaxID=290746 RepID=A0A914E058_9BILA
MNLNISKLSPKKIKGNLHDLSTTWDKSTGAKTFSSQQLTNLLTNPIIQGLFAAYDEIVSHEFDDTLPEIPFELDDDDIAVRIVHLVKGNEPLGATIKFDHSTGAVVIARIIAGGAAERSGCIEVGDQLLEVNGVSLLHKQPAEVVQLLSAPENETISFKLIPAKHVVENKPQPTLHYVRCMLDYSIKNDPMHPCPEAALDFKKGDILEFLVCDDPNFFQAKRLGHGSLCDMRNDENESSLDKDEETINESVINRVGLVPCVSFLRKLATDMNSDINMASSSTEPYEAVEKLDPSNNVIRPIILIGPPGVGRNELKRRLIMYHPKKYATIVPHTSRTRRPHERDGIDYYFASRNEMEKWIREGRFVEFGEYNGNLYGTLDEAISTVMEKGKIPVLNAHQLALTMLRTTTFKPIIIFVEPPDLMTLKETRVKMQARLALSGKEFTDADFEKMIQQAEQLQKCYGHFFDDRITNGNLDEAFKQLLMIIKKFESLPSWVPKDWIEKSVE